MSDSVRFDRAAEFYDASRAIAPEAMERTIELLAGELRGRGRTLEVGVGTGLLALPLHEAGVAVAGLDISGPMLSKLVDKAGGSPPFPLALGDATRMPFADDAFDAAYLRWVLHLVEDWRALVAEVVRIVRAGGVFVANLGSYGGAHEEIRKRFEELTGFSTAPIGLDWDAFEELDAELAQRGATLRILPSPYETFEETLEEFVRGIEENRYSWTWSVPEELRLRAVAEIRPWAEDGFGALDVVQPFSVDTTWRAYDLP
ncbi:MAG TPA: class I SAM-dependent methyltransferase [Actinomycetota bacterium]|nr:class I SAM-dependent methyltransferase [Actinomycetota bacterium]